MRSGVLVTCAIAAVCFGAVLGDLPCPPEIPQGCCPTKERVANLIKVVKLLKCERDNQCNEPDLCCFGYCVPTIHQSQDCCCPEDTVVFDSKEKVAGKGTIRPILPRHCVKDAQCPGNQLCCGPDRRKTCRAPVPCPCKGTSKCYCQGDPHCRSYDGNHWNFHGTCEYSLSRDACVDGQPSACAPNFHIITSQFQPYSSWAYVKDVTITFPYLGEVVIFRENGDVEHGIGNVITMSINGPINIDVPNKRLSAPALGLNKVQLGPRPWAVDVDIACWLKNRMCGLCADSNTDISNDQQIGPHQGHCPSVFGATDVPGTLTTNENTFGMSWQVGPVGCTCDVPFSRQVPTRGKRQASDNRCDRLLKAFRGCDPSEVAAVHADCVTDGTSSGRSGAHIDWLCYYAETLAGICKDSATMNRLRCPVQ